MSSSPPRRQALRFQQGWILLGIIFFSSLFFVSFLVLEWSNRIALYENDAGDGASQCSTYRHYLPPPSMQRALLASSIDSDRTMLDSLSLNSVRFKASHNSVDNEVSIFEQLLYGNCSAIELDVVMMEHPQTHTSERVKRYAKYLWNAGASQQRASPEGIDGTDDLHQRLPTRQSSWRFGVKHHPPTSSRFHPSSRQYVPDMANLLSEISAFMNVRPAGHPLFLWVDLQGGALLVDERTRMEFPLFLDNLLRETLGEERIFTPRMLDSWAARMCAAKASLRCPSSKVRRTRHVLSHQGWPTMGDLRGTILVVLSGRGSSKDVRALMHSYDEEGDLAFIDVDVRTLPMQPHGTFAERVRGRHFLNLRVVDNRHWNWKAYATVASTHGMITRGWKVNTQRTWDELISHKVHIMATDHPLSRDWAFLEEDQQRLN